MLRKIIMTVLAGLILTGSFCCSKKEETAKIDIEKKKAISVRTLQEGEKPLRIAVGGMITPREGFAYYRQLLDYIGEKLDRHVDFVDKENYAEINEMVRLGEVDAAFVCGGPYVDGHSKFGMELLVAPQSNGETVYYSYIIVKKDSPIKSFEELRGKSFAFTDPLSNSGRLVPEYMLAKMHETPDSFFKKYIYTNAHDKSIKAVAQGIVDGAAVDSLIWEYLNRTDPKFTSRTKRVRKSPPYGIPPFVVSKGMTPELKEKLKQIFLGMHNDEKGKEILKGMMIDKFVAINDSAYDSIREMKSWLASRQKETRKIK